MEKNLGLIQQIKESNDEEFLKSTLFALLKKIDSLEDRLQTLKENTDEKNLLSIEKKYDRLEQIRHGITEMSERMEKPYVISSELQSVKEVLDILAESGDCNSVILEGEPGTGKTQWTYSEVGQELQEGKDVELIHVRIKDTMRAQDLLYSIDDVRRLSDAQAKTQIPEDIKNEAAHWKQKIINGEINPTLDDEYNIFKAKMGAVSELSEAAKDLNYINYIDLGPLGEAIYQSGKGKKVYLLIDEIEKGREELMTGILDEIENLTFTINETGTVVKGDKKNLRIVITTNTEDSDKIPSSFRRRSLYHYIDYPSRANMAQIVELNFPNIQKELLSYAIEVFYKYHENIEIQKKPSTPELLAWIQVLRKEINFDSGIPEDIPHKEILLKYTEDQKIDIGSIRIESQDENGLNSRVLMNRQAKLENNIAILSNEINEWQSRCNELTGELQELQQSYNGKTNETNKIIENLNEELENLKTEFSEVSSKLNSLEESLEDDEEYEDDENDEESSLEEAEELIGYKKSEIIDLLEQNRKKQEKIEKIMQKLKIALSSPGMMGKKLKEAVNLVLESCEE